jgi:glutamyl-tRNA synthetase
VFPLKWEDKTSGFREMGFLNEAMVNYLALLGWNNGDDEELYTMEDLILLFSVNGVQKGGARFDYEKARWINHQYILKKSSEELCTMTFVKKQLAHFDEDKHLSILNLIKERLYTLADIEKEIQFLEATYPYDKKVFDKLIKNDPLRIAKQIKEYLSNGLSGNELKNSLMDWAKANKIKLGFVMQSFRLAMVGKLTGPDLFEICKVLGKEVSLKRINLFIDHINNITKH